MFVYGTTWYLDAFGRRRYTNFCFYISWWLRMMPPIWITVIRHSDSN